MNRLILFFLFVIAGLGQTVPLTPIGVQRTLVYAINGTDPVTARDSFFGTAASSLDSFYRAASYGKTWFTGDVVSVFITMPTACDVVTVYQRADAAAVAMGVNLDLYSRRAYLATYPCPWGGLGPIGVAGVTPGGVEYGMIFLQRGGAVVHEMGHSLGMAHASGHPYSSSTEYADPTSVMGGGGGLALPNAPHRVALGWLEASDTTVGGTFTLSPLSQTYGLRVLRIPKPNTNQWYYVSYRQPFGSYDNFYFSGVTIHVWNPHDALTAYQETTQIVDTNPGTSVGYLDAALTDGKSFTDQTNGIQITQVSHGSTFAVVSVVFGPVSPPPPPPPPPPAFAVGDRVFTLVKTKVTASASSNKPVCSQAALSWGTLEAYQSTQWRVNFDVGCDGWVTGSALTK